MIKVSHKMSLFALSTSIWDASKVKKNEAEKTSKVISESTSQCFQ